LGRKEEKRREEKRREEKKLRSQEVEKKRHFCLSPI
jgi:hypothetical protein